MDEREDEPVIRPDGARRPLCMDCHGTGTANVPRAFAMQSGERGTLMVPGRCPACRGTGKAGA